MDTNLKQNNKLLNVLVHAHVQALTVKKKNLE